MFAQGRILGHRKGAAAAKKKRESRKVRTAGSLVACAPAPGQHQLGLGLPGGPEVHPAFTGLPGQAQAAQAAKKRDPYAVPRREGSVRLRQQQPQQKILLSQDPLIRVMMDERVDADYSTMSEGGRKGSVTASGRGSPVHLADVEEAKEEEEEDEDDEDGNKKRRRRRGRNKPWRSFFKCLPSVPQYSLRSVLSLKRRSPSKASNISEANRRKSSLFLEGEPVALDPTALPGNTVLSATLRSLGIGRSGATVTSGPMHGRVTTACLWHACQAVTLGVLLIIVGIVMSVLGNRKSIEVLPPSVPSLICLGYVEEREKLDARIESGETPPDFVPGVATVDRFRLKNFSFAGPVIMGIGGRIKFLYQISQSTRQYFFKLF